MLGAPSARKRLRAPRSDRESVAQQRDGSPPPGVSAPGLERPLEATQKLESLAARLPREILPSPLPFRLEATEPVAGVSQHAGCLSPIPRLGLLQIPLETR
jgi:hypothetical protein